MKIENQNSRIYKDSPAFLVICIMILIAISLGVTYPVYSLGITSADNEVIASVPPDINCSYQTNTTFEAQVIELINAERTKVGLLPLYAQSQLGTAARLHSADMACNNFFSHTGSDGSSLTDRIMRQGYSGYYFGENIAAGYSTPESVVNAWMNSSGHRANILNTNYTEIGVGYAYWAGSTYDSYWTTDFAFPNTYSISGKAGMQGGVILSYLDGTTKTVQTDASGNYTIRVPSGWSGSVTPSYACYTFNPTDRTYDNVTIDQTAQDFTPIFNHAAGCADVEVEVGGVHQSNHGILAKTATKVSYPDLNNGPLRVKSTDSTNIVSSERVVWGVGYDELMGYPADQLTTEYLFPWYNNVAMNSQLRVGNTGNVAADVDVYIGDVKITAAKPYTIAVGGSVRLSYTGVNDGPVRIVTTTAGATILASERVIWGVGYDELMGYPVDRLTTEYLFPWYNDYAMNSQLRVANTGNVAVDVEVYIGNEHITAAKPYTIPVGGSVRLAYPGMNDGPVRIVTSTAGASILASERVIWLNGYDELMGYPADQLTNEYVFPLYTNVSKNSQLRIGNTGNVAADVDVYIGDVKITSSAPYTIPVGGSVRLSYTGLEGGPLRVVTSTAGASILATERVINGTSTGTGYDELMGYASNALKSEYLFPWYNNYAMQTQAVVGAP
jgi:uncharacterized protein YkwD